MMESILYAEVYGVCILILGIIFLWSVRRRERSASDLWLNRTYLCFLLNFLSNLFFTLFNRILVFENLVIPVSYFLKTTYLMTLAAGTFCWCGYAEMAIRSPLFTRKSYKRIFLAVLAAICLFILSNLQTHSIFIIDEAYQYRRYPMFRGLLGILLAISLFSSIRVLMKSKAECDPSRRGYFYVVSSFPLCLLVALLLTNRESIPVICVCILTALFCLFVENSSQSVSTDTLTRVNNRQNLNRFMTYKLINYEEQVWLMMIDADHFKSINDSFGHLEGDAALERISGILKKACQSVASRPFIARYGGDEFVIVMEGTEEEANRLIERIHALMKESDQEGKPYQLRVSIGLAKRKAGMTYEQLVDEADARLYEVKKNRPPWHGFSAAGSGGR